jgi:anaerobic magnesium-protoporphyrin IX monomethyl ester cyclase
MTDIVLIYPFFRPKKDNSHFRFPPLGLGYIAAHLHRNGISVQLIDCTFQTQGDVVQQVNDLDPKVIGIQCILSADHHALKLAKMLNKDDNILVAGGPYPTIDPARFLSSFDIAVIGEGEETALEIVEKAKENRDFRSIPGIAYIDDKSNGIRYTKSRQPQLNLDSLPNPMRSLYPNALYQKYNRSRFGYSMTSLIATRGCPFRCDYCSRAVSGNSYRERSKESVVNEIEEIMSYGYDRIWIADDVFTLRKQYVNDVCQEIIKRKTKCEWECLSRVDTLDYEIAKIMKAAGCRRVFFGIESGNNDILRKMKKSVTVEKSAMAVSSAKRAGLETGGFFILGYPGETDETILQTLKLSSSLPLDYISFSFPYPFPGTGLYEKVKDRLLPEYSSYSRNGKAKHRLVFRSDFSARKLRFALFKGKAQFRIKSCFGGNLPSVYKVFEGITNSIFRIMK